MEGTLHTLAEEVDERRYVSRDDVALRIEAWLASDSPHRILVFHGPGGIGKSAVLREIGRRAASYGYEVLRLDGRELAESPSLEEALADLIPAATGRFLAVVDEIDSLGAGLHALGAWIATLPVTARVALAGRARPPRGWIDESLQLLTDTCRLPPLNDVQSRALLQRLDVEEPERIDAVLRWAMGSPLALVVAARAAGGLVAGTFNPEVLDDLIERIARAALEDADREALQAASISWSVDEALLAALLPHRDGARSLRRLIELDFVEQLGDRAVVHPIVARAVTERLQVVEPRLFRSLTMRAASHLRERAVDGDGPALADLANLLRDPVLRDGLGPAFSERYYADRIRPEDLASLKATVEPGLWPLIEPWARTSLSECLAARLRTGECVGLSVAFGARSLGAINDQVDGRQRNGSRRLKAGFPADELARPLLEFASRLEQPERAVVSPFQLAFDRESSASRTELMRFMNAMAVMRCGIVNPRYDIVNGIGWTEREQEVAIRYGYEEVPELRRSIAGHEMRTWFADSGAGGLAGLIYHAIAAENGIEVSGECWADVVLDALENFHDDTVLARLAVAPHGHDQAESAALVRGHLRGILDRALGGAPELKAIIEARYLVPGQSHDAAMRVTYQSRSSYYRKLRQARETLVAACE